jgi:glucose-6-phosphate 1-epimerase
VFRTSEPVTVVDRALGRRLVVTTDGARNVVVWNPWEEKAAAVPDIGPGEWRRFVCVEGANVFESAVGLEPGESRTMTYSIEVEEL